MKLWQLISIFRTEKDKVKDVLKEQRYTELQQSFEILGDFVRNQNRNVLDQEIPMELVKEICRRSDLKFWLYSDNGELILSSYKRQSDDPFELLSPLDIIERFNNGALMEEALEFGTAKIEKTNR